MFDFLKGKNKGPLSIGSPVAGEVVPLSQVSDPTFGEEILGKGIAVNPEEGKVVAPVNGLVTVMFETKHAVSITSDEGVEILIHVGLDTVNLKGQHFTSYVKEGDKVKTGDLLMEFDMEAIQKAGYPIITPMVICNSDDYKSVTGFTGKQAARLDEVLQIEK